MKKEYGKNRRVLPHITHLLQLVNQELKYNRSISISKIKRSEELLNSNLLYSNDCEEGDNNCYMPNPITFRKLDGERGYESQGINSLVMPSGSNKMSIMEDNKLQPIQYSDQNG